MEECVHFVMNQASKVHKSTLGPLSRKFNIVEQIRKSSAKHLPVDAYQKASGKLYISLTRVADFQNVIVSQYDSNKDLIDVSFFLMFYFFYVNEILFLVIKPKTLKNYTVIMLVYCKFN